MENLCDALIDEILSRLPLKSAVMCKSISKRFNTLISAPQFVNKLTLRKSSILHCSYDSPTKYNFNVALYPDEETGFSVKQLPHPMNRILAYFIEHQQFPGEALGLAVEPIASSLQQYKVVYTYEYRKDVYRFRIFSSDTMSSKTSMTELSCIGSKFYDSALPVYSHGSLHWLRNCGDIVAFDVEKEVARIIKLPTDFPLPFTYAKSRFGELKGLVTLISTSGEEILVWILNDNKKDEWVDKTRITNVIDWEWPIRIPIFYDGEILVLHQRQRGDEGELRMYDIVADKWRKFGVVEGKMDNVQAFVPFVPSIAEIKTTTDHFYFQSSAFLDVG
uniref:F-box domain-containing protein n=1 Tax=Fagus sylvatica TaxID=28930 RepID=A0A2N9F8U4_FAGSY